MMKKENLNHSKTSIITNNKKAIIKLFNYGKRRYTKTLLLIYLNNFYCLYYLYLQFKIISFY